MRIKAKLLGATQYDDYLFDKKAVLPVSVTQLYHEGDKLIATLDLIQKRFSSCDIIVSDTLQRHNYLENHTPEDAMQITYQLGTEWIERNIHLLDTAIIPFTIIRWNQCLAFSGFPSSLKKIELQYEHDSTLQTAMMEDVSAFLQRHSTVPSMKNFTLHCRNYLFEEAAVVISYFIDKEYDYIVYPSAIPRFIEKCRELFVSTKSPKLLHNLKIYFKKTNTRIGV